MQVDVEIFYNSISEAAIFRELCDAKGPLVNIIPFARLFYGTNFSLYF
jgi:hypothetical protein